MPKEPENTNCEARTTMSLSLTVADKQFLKIYAAQHEKTVAAVVHELVENLRNENES